MQHLLNLFQEARIPLFGIQLFCLFEFVDFVLLPIHGGKIEQLLLISALGNGDIDAFQFHVDRKRDDDLFCPALETLAHFDDAERKQFLFALIQSLFVFERVGLYDGTIPDVQVINICRRVVFRNRKDIDIVKHRGHYG